MNTVIQWNNDIGAQVRRIAEKYWSDAAFRKEAERDSWAVVRQLPQESADLISRRVGNRDLRIHFSTDKTMYVVLPAQPPGEAESLNAEDLSAISGGGCASTVGSLGTAGTVPSTASSGGTVGSASSVS